MPTCYLHYKTFTAATTYPAEVFVVQYLKQDRKNKGSNY